ncbi:Predicted arabinose efflux permease, MFS family [Paraburkholderia fungorum]|uniref:Predicted arabinose efflux permease, MFS family n=1 Tax=Paraburkholderia fungorum TaxID=134537 RepID=A0A1H1JDI6_9BURK|nr:MFS transporter [Paraburkholderia fungorum]SDR48064.1 Predicted arabinose efflux permease, MFS family [Paraburkholderia fungorum]
MQSWYSSMLASQRRTFWACFLGWVLDAMDVQIFAFVIPTLLTIWGMTKAQAGVLGTSALIFSAVGGVVAGLLADRIGRVRVLKIAILWFSLFTGLSALTNDFHQLLVTRSLQGLGFGGEWAAGAVLIGEVVDKRIRGRAVGSVQSGWPVGYALAALAYWALYSGLPEHLAWRALFMIGILPGLLVLWMRRNIEESSAFEAAAEYRKKSGLFGTFALIFSPGVFRLTALASLMAAGALGGNYTILTWLVTYLRQTQSLTVGMTSVYLAVNIFGSFCGYIGMAYLSDGLGRRKTFALSAAGATVTVLVYTQLHLPMSVLLLLGFPLGLFQSGIVSGMGACFTELFPAQIRGTAGGFSYNFGRGIGALVPAAVGLTSTSMGLAKSIGVWAALAYLLVFAVAIVIPETRNKELEVHV